MSDKKITYNELVDKIAEDTGETKERTDEFIKETVKAIDQGLERDNRVRIAKFGVFELRPMAEKEGTDPQTQETIIIPAHTRVAFKPSRSLRRQVNRRYISRSPKYLEGDQPDEEERSSRRPLVFALLGVALIAIIALFLLRDNFTNDRTVSPQVVENEQAGEAEQSTEPSSEEPSSPTTDTSGESAEVRPEDTPGAGNTDKPVESARSDEIQKDEAQEDETQSAETQRTNTQSADTQSADTQTNIHTVQAGDHLWDLADVYYENSYFWVNIYRTNANEIDNPDLIIAGIRISVPVLEGNRDALTPRDSLNLAQGFFEAYKAYKELNNQRAKYYLWAADNYNNGIMNEHKSYIADDDLRFVQNYNEGR